MVGLGRVFFAGALTLWLPWYRQYPYASGESGSVGSTMQSGSGSGMKRKCSGPITIMPGIGGTADTDLRRQELDEEDSL